MGQCHHRPANLWFVGVLLATTATSSSGVWVASSFSTTTSSRTFPRRRQRQHATRQSSSLSFSTRLSSIVATNAPAMMIPTCTSSRTSCCCRLGNTQSSCDITATTDNYNSACLNTAAAYLLTLTTTKTTTMTPTGTTTNSHDDMTTTTTNTGIIPMDTPARQSLPDHLRLEAIPGKGLGVILAKGSPRITKGTVVGEYKGDVMSGAVKDRRYLKSQSHLQTPTDVEWKQSRLARGQTITGTYLYGVVVPNNKNNDDMIYIDAEDEYTSLWTRFLNHAPPPLQTNVNPKSIHESWNGEPRVWFVANRDIDLGEEICFDYGDDYWLPEDNVVV